MKNGREKGTSRLVRNKTIRNLLALVGGALVTIASAYATLTILKAFDSDPVDTEALVKGALAALAVLLTLGVVVIRTVRAEASARKARA